MKLTTQRIDPDLVRQVTILAAIIGSIVINTISNFFPPDGVDRQPCQIAVTKHEVEKDIKSAFKRSAMLDAEHIRVETSGNNVTLHGQVRNYSEYDEAERVAWSEPGVSYVDNRLAVDWMF
jgi:osmotically-inducible protein OsmY